MMLQVRYINPESGKTEETRIENTVEEIEFWNRQRSGEVSVISVRRA
jgi:hypothetical protein